MNLFRKFINKSAQSSAQVLVYKNEFSGEYMLLTALKIVISIISVLTGYIAAKAVFLPILPYEFMAVFLAVIVLVVVEVANFFTASKAVKYIFRRHYFNAVIFAVLAVFCFRISFVASVEGLRSQGTKVADNTEIIESESKEEIEQLNIMYNGRIAKINEAIEQIKPPTWNKNKLTTKQQTQLIELNSKIDNLEGERLAEIKQAKQQLVSKLDVNTTASTDNGNKYAYIIGVALFVQLIASIIRGYMDKTIYFQNDTENYIRQDVTALTSSLKEQAKTELLETSKFVTNTILADFAAMRNLAIAETAKDNSVIELPEIGTETKKTKRNGIGFTSQKQPDLNSRTEALNGNVIRNENGTEIPKKEPINGKRSCEFCGNSLHHKSPLARFCSDRCRVANWKAKNPNGHIKFG